MKTPVLALAIITVATTSFAADAQIPSPKPWLKGVVDKARILATKKVKAGPAEDQWKADIKALIDDTLHWDALTRRALGRNWKKRSPAEQEEFAKLLREMIEASYQSKLRVSSRQDVSGKIEIVWLEETVKKDKAVSIARVKSGKSEAVLEFKMMHEAGNWRVYDVTIDDVSTVRTYRSQFGKIIAKEGFDELMNRMRRKTEEIRNGLADVSAP